MKLSDKKKQVARKMSAKREQRNKEYFRGHEINVPGKQGGSYTARIGGGLYTSSSMRGIRKYIRKATTG